MVRTHPSLSKQHQHKSRLTKGKKAKKTIHVTIHSIKTTDTKKSLDNCPDLNSISIDNEQKNGSNTTTKISISRQSSEKTTPTFDQRKTLLKDLTHIDQNHSNMNNTRANYMDYKNNQKKKKNKNKCKILSILTVIAILLSVLIISTILLIIPKETDKSTTTLTTSTTTSITSLTSTSTSSVSRTTTTSTTTTSITSSTSTSTSSVSTTSTTTTTTPRYPISCFANVTASSFSGLHGTPTQQADGLVDRPNINTGTFFNAGWFPPQWVQLELPGLYNITRIDLLVNQGPNGTTTNQILIGSNSSSLQLVANLTAYTFLGEWLNFTYNPELTNVRFVRANTIYGPSYVAWSKFIVYDF